MLNQFVQSLVDNLADILTIAALIVVVGGGVWFWLARKRRVDGIRRRLLADLELPGGLKETLAKALNADVAEMSALGAVSVVDVAWQYSLADPAIWDHFTGPAADHIANAMQNVDILKSALGDHAFPLVDNLLESLRSIEALSVFGDMASALPESAAHVGTAAVEAKSSALVDMLASSVWPHPEATASAVGLDVHIPLVTIAFAGYRAWRRSQKNDTTLKRNVEFAAVEVTTRAGGGLVGGKLGGVVGSLIVPGVGTVVGTVAGIVGGALGGAALGETIKKRHIEKASRQLDRSLESLGGYYLESSGSFNQVVDVFERQEQQYVSHLDETRRRLRRYSMPWRVAWPDEKLILLQETVHLAEDRLGSVKTGAAEAVDRLIFLRETDQRRQMGLLLLGNPALCTEIPCQPELIDPARAANERLIRELSQLGLSPQAVN